MSAGPAAAPEADLPPPDREPARTAIVFPALGPVRKNELGTFLMISPYARERVAVASEVLGYHIADALHESDDDYSVAMQVAYLIACLSLADFVEQALGVAPDFCAGPSFGERTALAYTGALAYPDAVRLVELIARVEHDYFAREHTDVVTHSFVRVTEDKLKDLLTELDSRGEWYDVSGYLDHDFHMVSLREPALAGFKAAISAVGGYSMSTMRPPAHAAIFGPLREQVARAFDQHFTLRTPRVPIVSYQDGVLLDNPAALRSALLDGFVRPIRWLDTVSALQKLKAHSLYFAGPDTMFHRLRSTVEHFDVDLVDLRRVLRPPRRAQR